MNQARDNETREIIEAEELKHLDRVNHSNYECLDENCRVRLIPCSYGEKNRKRPFFKLPKFYKHKKECRFSEYLRLLEEARRRRLEEGELKKLPYPATLITKSAKKTPSDIPEIRLSSVREVTSKLPAESIKWDWTQGSNRSVTSISQIVDFYLSCPYNRDLDLDILGYNMQYRYWFKRIKGKSDGQYFARRIFYGRLSMKHDCIQSLADEIVIELYECESWIKPSKRNWLSLVNTKTPENPYKIHVSKAGLSSHKLTRVMNEIDYAIKGQKEAHKTRIASDKRAYIFFLADPPEEGSYHFDVLDGHLVSRYVKIDRHKPDETW